jgi:hypothetical protein
MHSYQSVHGRLPPAVVYGADQKLLLSWRVLLLPHIEQDNLFRQFKLEEPWDSPHNLPLLAKMPTTYAAPGRKARIMPPDHTVCHVFVGKGAAFEGREGLHLPDDFPDGVSNTILIIEAGPPVPWTKPEELVYDPDLPLPELPGIFGSHFRVGMGDGSVRWLGKDVPEATLRAAITRNGGETLGQDWNR